VEEPNGIIFVVDDDASVRKSLRRLLKSAGFEVETFASGAQFLARVPEARDGVVILDLRMPAQSGLEVQRALCDRGTPMRVIFITAHDDDAARDDALARGAVGFVRKPFDQDVLLGVVERAVALAQPAGRTLGHSEPSEPSG
jgi:two-component system response regulator FixJ